MGGNEVSVELNGTYTEPGFSANDDSDGDITSSVETTGTVDVNQVGIYTITYSTSDAAGNESSVNRTVTVYNTSDYLSGGYSVSVSCPGTNGYPDVYPSTLNVSDQENNRIFLSSFSANFGNNLGELEVLVEGSDLIIEDQSINGHEFTGSGEIDGENLIIQGENCTQTFIKN